MLDAQRLCAAGSGSLPCPRRSRRARRARASGSTEPRLDRHAVERQRRPSRGEDTRALLLQHAQLLRALAVRMPLVAPLPVCALSSIQCRPTRLSSHPARAGPCAARAIARSPPGIADPAAATRPRRRMPPLRTSRRTKQIPSSNAIALFPMLIPSGTSGRSRQREMRPGRTIVAACRNVGRFMPQQRVHFRNGQRRWHTAPWRPWWTAIRRAPPSPAGSPCSRRSASTSRTSVSVSPCASRAGTRSNSDCGTLRTFEPSSASASRSATSASRSTPRRLRHQQRLRAAFAVVGVLEPVNDPPVRGMHVHTINPSVASLM